MKCPFLTSTHDHQCRGEECGLWSPTFNQCSLAAIAEVMEEVVGELEEIKEHLEIIYQRGY